MGLYRLERHTPVPYARPQEFFESLVCGERRIAFDALERCEVTTEFSGVPYNATGELFCPSPFRRCGPLAGYYA